MQNCEAVYIGNMMEPALASRSKISVCRTPAEYGFKRPDWFDKGLEYNAWLEYEWDTVLEFCQMILETKNYANADITPYLPLIESSLTFFDEHYQQLASHPEDGKRWMATDI